MPLREWKVLVAYTIASDGTLLSQTYVSNGKSVYPSSSVNKADTKSAPSLQNVYRLVYYPLSPPPDLNKLSPLLVLDVLPALSTVTYQNQQLKVEAKIYTPLADLPVSWRSLLMRSGQSVDYATLKISLNNYGETELVYGNGLDKLSQFLRAKDHTFDQLFFDGRTQFSRLDGIPGYFATGLHLEHLKNSVGLDLPDFISNGTKLARFQCVRALFVKAADVWNDDARTYYVIVFRLPSTGGRQFRLFNEGLESFLDEDVPDGWELLHRPSSTISPNADTLDLSQPTQNSILHVYNIPARNIVKLWNTEVGTYHDSLTNVSGGQPVSFLPQFGSDKADPVPGSRWTMTYQINILMKNFTTADAFPAEATFSPTGGGAAKPAITIAPLSLHLSDRPSVAGRPRLPAARLPRVRDVGGQPLRLDFNPTATVRKRIDTAEIDELDQAELVYGIAMYYSSAIASKPAPGSEGVVRMGALDVTFGGQQPAWKDRNSWLIVRRDGRSIRIHIDTFFAVADVGPGGQDDPAGEEYVPDNSVVFGANACAVPILSRTNTGAETKAAAIDSEIENSFRRKRPLVIHLDDEPAGNRFYALRVKEDVVPLQSRAIKLSLYSQNPAEATEVPADICSTPNLRHAVVLDRSPFLVAEVRYLPFEGVSSNESSIIATWDNTVASQGAAWMLQFQQQPFCLVMPPQAVGEEMVKSNLNDRPDPLPKALPFRFSPPARLSVDPRKQQTSFAEAPWNLRRILGTPQDPTPGPMVNRMQYELLYGLSCDADQPMFRLAELIARVGQIAGRREPQLAWKGTDAQKIVYDEARTEWAHIYRRYLSRIAVLEPWSGLINSTTSSITLKEHLTCSIRSTADMANPITLQNHPGSTGSSLRGGVTWGFESKNIYDQVVKPTPSGAMPPSSEASLENFSISALGGWGKQYASFLEGLTKVYADVEMGRTSMYKLERLGRIGIWYTLAKHVIIYRRSVAPSRQFYKNQPKYFGIPVPRKVEEYVEILEDSRPYPDNLNSLTVAQQATARQARGPIGSILLTKGMRFNVDSAWGSDISDSNGSGWKVPLWSPSAWPPDVYPKPAIGIGAFVGDSSSGAKQPPVIDNPETLVFFTQTSVNTGNVDPDPHNWGPMQDIEYVNAPLPSAPVDFASADPRQTVPKPSIVPPIYGPCTFRLVPGPLPVNLVADRAAKPMAAQLESITVVRAVATGTSPALPPMAAVVHAIQDRVNDLASGVLHALPSGGATSDAVDPKVFDELKAAAKDPLQSLRTQISAAQTALASIPKNFQTAASAFEKELGAKFKSSVDAAVQAFSQDYADAAQKLTAAFDVTVARQFILSQQRRFEETLLLPDATPGPVSAMIAKYADTTMAVKHTADAALAAFQQAIANWNANKYSIIRDLNNALSQAVSLAESLQTLRPPLETFPNPYSWAASKLGAILTDVRTQRDAFIASLNVAGSDPAAELAKFKATPFYKAIADPYPANILALVREAVGSQTLMNADDVHKALHKADVWINGYPAAGGAARIVGQVEQWDAQCQTILNGINTAQDLQNSVASIQNYLTKTLMPNVDTLIADVAAVTQKVVNVFDNEMTLMQGHLAQAVTNLENLLQPAATTLANLRSAIENQRDVLAHHAEDYLDKTFRQCGVDKTVFQVADSTFRVIRAFGAPPEVPNLSFGRDKLAYFFQEVSPVVDLTPVLSLVSQAGKDFDSLKTLGMALPTLGTLDQLIPPSLRGFNLSDIFGNMAGLDLRNLFPGLTLPDLSTDAVKIKQDIDPQTMRAVLRADINFQIADSSTLFTIGPVSVQIITATFAATATVTAGTDGVRRTTSGVITGDWQLVLSGVPFVKLKRTQLQFDDSGGIHFAIDPKSVELPGVLKLVSDLLNSVIGKDSGLSIGLLPDGFQSILKLPVPDIQGLTSGFSNLHLGGLFAIEFADTFTMSVGFSLASKDAPFSLTIFVLGGGGYLDARAIYTPAANRIGCQVNMAMTASASLAISLAVISGGVYVYFGATASYSTGAEGLTFGVMFLVRGEVSVLGIVSVAISLLLDATYGGGTLTGRGQLSIKIKICWCFTLEVNEAITYTLGKADNQPTTASIARPLSGPFLAIASAGPFEALSDAQIFALAAGVPTDDFDKYAGEYIAMLV